MRSGVGQLMITAGSARTRATPSTSALAIPVATTPGRQSLASTKSAKTSDGCPPCSAITSAKVWPSHRLVLRAMHFDEPDELGVLVGNMKLVDAIPLLPGGGPPRRITEQGGLLCRWGADEPVPALRHRHEHHRRCPVDPEVDAARRQRRVPCTPSAGESPGEVEPGVRHRRVGIVVHEAGPGQRDTSIAAPAREVSNDASGLGCMSPG